MKISKQLFKEYVKECLIEILTEGLSKTELNESIKKNSSVVIGSSDKPRTQQRDVESGKVNELVKSATSDAKFASLLEDTARNTLPDMLKSEQRSAQQVYAKGTAEDIVDQHDPEELFGNVANNWSNLAFASKKLPG